MPFPPMPALTYIYEARVLGVPHDGDTFRVLMRLGTDCDRETTIRLVGVNAPELGTKAEPIQAGVDARLFTIAWLDLAARSSKAGDWPLVVDSRGYDKYGGRIDAVV